AENNQVGKGNLLAARLRSVELLLDRFELLQHLRQLCRVVYLPVLLWREANPCPVGAPALVGATKARRRRPGGGNQLGDGESRGEDLALEGSDVLFPDQLMIDRRDGVLPRLWRRNPRAEVARDRTHVAVQQLVPRLAEHFCKLVRMLVEALRDRPIGGIHLQCKVRREHHRGLPLRRIMSTGRGGHYTGIRLGSVLLRTSRTRRQLIVVLVQVVQKPVVPLRRVTRPSALEPAL